MRPQGHFVALCVLFSVQAIVGYCYFIDYFRGIYKHGRGDRAIGREDNTHHGSELGQNSIYQDLEPNRISQILFLSPNYTVVQAQTRTTALLHCEVTNIGNNTVTWKRRKDYKLLTFGLLTYSSDYRFFTRIGRNGKDWCLHIRYVDQDDEGLYECQVTSHPPASIFVDLQLVEARAEILGGPDKIIKTGSSLRLSCILRRSTEQPEYIFWYHGQTMINFDLIGGAAIRHGRQDSELYIPKAESIHAGNYTCMPSNTHPVSVTVHVLQNEKPAAMQHGSKNISTTTSTTTSSSCRCCLTFRSSISVLLLNIFVHVSPR
nr:zwei Ig domain protein zig-8-like [Onthophagus taurus]